MNQGLTSEHVTVVYKWTAKPGKLEELAAIYADVTQAMNENEPGAEAVHCYISQEDGALYVRDEFEDAEALGYHLQVTAAAHFPQLLAIAVPGPFFFLGNVPQELKDATEQMQLGAEFGLHTSGFTR
ncbi:MAG: antibiotic biosynthesis monooxygenase [Bacteroidota bacterium]